MVTPEEREGKACWGWAQKGARSAGDKGLALCGGARTPRGNCLLGLHTTHTAAPAQSLRGGFPTRRPTLQTHLYPQKSSPNNQLPWPSRDRLKENF